MYRIKKQFIMLIFFLFVIIAFSNTVSADQSIIYVNDSGGNDSWNGEATTWDGATLIGPKKSIKNAIGTVTENGTVNIANGVYSGTDNTNITIDKNMCIIGQSREGTIINGTDSAQIFIIRNGINITIQNLTICNGTAGDGETYGYGSAIDNNGTCIVENVIFYGNLADFGGAIYNAGNLTINDSIFIENCGYYGGAIFNTGNLTVSGNFTENVADFGGAITSIGNLTVTDGNFAYNYANGVAGAIYTIGGTSTTPITILDSSFTGNFAPFYGGAIVNEGNLTVTRGNFIDNAAIFDLEDEYYRDEYGDGGAIYNLGNLTVANSNFINNNVTFAGGAIYNNCTLNITGSTLIGNNATTPGDNYALGGAVYNNIGSICTAKDCNLTGNIADYGGAIFNGEFGKLYVTDSEFIDNSAGWGGAIHCNAESNLTVTRCNFTSNTASAITNHGGFCNVTYSNFFNNTSSQGGAIYNEDGAMNRPDGTLRTGAILSVTRCTFTGNIASFYGSGAAIYNSGNKCTITGSTITDNNGVAIYSVAIYSANSNTQIHFNRIFNNTGSDIWGVGSINATNNWWGTNFQGTDPVTAGRVNTNPNISSDINVSTWLILSSNASPANIRPGSNSTIITDLQHDNLGTYYDPASGHVPDGIEVNFATNLWTISSPSFTSNGIAQAILNGGLTRGIANVSALVDNQNVNVFVINDINIIVNSNSTGGLFKESQSVLLTADDYLDPNPVIYYTTDGITWNHFTSSGTISITNEGTTTLEFYALDSLGNQFPLTKYNFTIDRIAPEVNATPAGVSLTKDPINVNLSSEIDTTIYYRVNDGSWNTFNGFGNVLISNDGINNLEFYAIDLAGNPSNQTIYSYIIDRIAPIIAANPVGGTYNASKSVILVTTDVNPTKTYYTTDGSNPKTSNTKKEYTEPILINNTTTLLFTAVDTAGNWGEIYNEKYTIDSFSVFQIENAASNVRNYVETYHKLPNTVQIGSNDVNIPQFLELLTTALLQINSGNNDLIYLRNFSAPINPTENIHAGNIYKSEYMKLAGDIKNYMDSTGKSPDYAYGTSIGSYLRFESLVYMYSMILDYYNTSGNIAGWAAMEPWSDITSRPVIDPNAPKFTVTQIENAASTLRTYVETYHKLPNIIQVGSTDISMSQFLELLTTALLQINSGNNNQISLRNFTDPVNPKESIHTGNIYKAEYMKLASDIKNYMDSTGKTPGYAYGTSIGSYLRFESLVYMYAMVLDYHRTSGNIAGWAAMEPWSDITSRPVVDPNAPKFTVDQIKTAAITVYKNVENIHNLPDKVTINGTDVSMHQFLELLTTVLLQINNGNNNTIILRNFTAPVNPTEDISMGIIYKTEYMKLANDIKNYMDNTGKTPDYVYGTSIGPKLRFENIVYMYSMILDYQNRTGIMPVGVLMAPWSMIISIPIVDPNAPKFTVDQIKIAASTVRHQIETNHNLPDKVTINGTDVKMPQFLELLTTALIHICSGNSSAMPLMNFTAPTNPKEIIWPGNIYQEDYVQMAAEIKYYMDSTGKTPDYVYETSIGPYLRYENLIYMYTMILDYYNTSGRLADWAAMKPWAMI